MIDPRIQIAQDLAKIKGMERSPWVLIGFPLNKAFPVRRDHIKTDRGQTYYSDHGITYRDFTVYGSYLRLAYEDGNYSSASIREGLRLRIKLERFGVDGIWYVEGYNFDLNLKYPAADDWANQIGIIEYHKQYPKEVENYLKGLSEY